MIIKIKCHTICIPWINVLIISTHVDHGYMTIIDMRLMTNRKPLAFVKTSTGLKATPEPFSLANTPNPPKIVYVLNVARD